MKVRGERECQQCGTRWSYYETGSIECPECESLRSVGLNDRTTHTDTPVKLDLSAHQSRFGEAHETLPKDGVTELKTDIREYTRKRGFIRGGELLTLDSAYLAARELLEAVDIYDRIRDPTDTEREYLFSLLAGAADGVRPPTEDVPESLRKARGMATVHAVEEYRRDLLVYLDELESREVSDDTVSSETDRDAVGETVKRDSDTAASRSSLAQNVLEQLRDRTKRVEALGGDVSPTDADALVNAANAIGEFIRNGDDIALTRAQDTLSEQSI
ncbi:DUF7117 family protein [Halorubrum laminariae]|uniref:TFIIB-type zinc ribbon-containing protein n=1 Tax=Halorubrum laminariae TaxID=1433523 RepID=A0ABD6BW63_9EURY|nr:hypothetical protein [Halorubrum laminariae]